MEKTNPEIERFDKLFDEISFSAKNESDGRPDAKDTEILKITPEIGDWAIRFTVFRPSTPDSAYSPSITTHIKSEKRHPHVKRFDLESSNELSKEAKRQDSIDALGEIEELFAQYRVIKRHSDSQNPGVDLT